MKDNRIECESKMSDTKLLAYGQKEPLEFVGTFVAELVRMRSERSKVRR